MAVKARAAETRRRLIDAAGRLFTEIGYLETTPKDIAAAANLTSGAFYYHFSSKEEIGAAIAEQVWPGMERVLNIHLAGPAPGLTSVTQAVFAAADRVFSDELQWIGFFLDHAIGHLSPAARQAHRERLAGFTTRVPQALLDSELRDGISRREAGDLLWVAWTGALLMSGALEERGSAVYERLAMAWSSAVRSIVPPESFDTFDEAIRATVARFSLVSGLEDRERTN